MPASRRPGGTKRPYFTDREFERIAEEALASVELLPSSPGPVRIDRFIEKRFGVTPRFEPLPDGLLGLTRFTGQGEVNAVIVARQLSDAESRVAERRINTTLAHEGGHGLLHASLFAVDRFPRDLFEGSEDVEPNRILCRDEGVDPGPHQGYRGEWWELQANRMIGALLLPKGLVGSCIEDLIELRGLLERAVLPVAARDSAVARLSEVFDVNAVVARLRIERLFPEEDREQLTL
jgi:hypothetical protein